MGGPRFSVIRFLFFTTYALAFFTACGGGGGLPPIVISAPDHLPDAEVGEPYGPVNLIASGGTPPYTFQATLKPAWLQLSENTGQLTGTPDVVSTSVVTFVARDATGRASSPRTYSLKVRDSRPPDTTITDGPCNLQSPCYTRENRVTFHFSSSEANSSFWCVVDNEPVLSCVSPFTTLVLSDGEHSFRVWARDAAGNDDQTPATFSFIVDTVPPTPPNLQPPIPADRRLLLTWQPASDATSGIAGYFIYFSTQSGFDPRTCNCRWNQNLLPPETEFPVRLRGLTNGTLYYVVVTAVDRAGNESSGSSEVSDRPRRYSLITPDNDENPALASGGGRALVVFQRNAGTSADIWAHWVTRDGVPEDDFFQIASGSGELAIHPAVTYIASSDFFVVAWEAVNTVSGQSKIQAVAVQNQPPYVSGTPIEISGGQSHATRVSIAGFTDHAIAVWSNDGRIYSSRINGLPLSATAPYLVNASDLGAATLPAIAVNSATQTALVAYEIPGTTGTDIYGMALNQDGQPLGSSFVLADLPESAGAPSVASAPSAFLVAFHVSRSPAYYDIYGVLAKADGSGTLAPSFVINDYPSAKILTSIGYHLPTRKFLCAWMDTRNMAVSERDILGAFVTDAGGVGPEFTISGDRGQQHTPEVATGIAEFLVAYRDKSRDPNGDFDIGISLVDPEFTP